MVDTQYLDKQIRDFPWSREIKNGRLPRPVGKECKGIGHWKAEGLQKFSFPMTTCMFENKFEDDEEFQTIISQLTAVMSNIDKLIRSENTASRSVRFVPIEKALFGPYTVPKLHLIKETEIFPCLIWERGLYGLTIRTVHTDRKGTFWSVYRIKSWKVNKI